MTTPRIPNRGRVEISEGIAAAVARASAAGGWTGWNSCASHVCLLIVSCGRLQLPKGPDAKLTREFESSSAIFTGILCTTFV